MPSFSERMGLVEVRSVVQKDEIDGPLRAKLWDLVRIFFLDDSGSAMEYSAEQSNYRAIWTGFFERPGDEVPALTHYANDDLRTLVLNGVWYRTYDLIEFLLKNGQPRSDTIKIRKLLNAALDKYMSAYRFINNEFVPIADELQISQIETALSNPLIGVQKHLSKGLTHLADREAPDVENSIKESILAVESICSAIVGKRSTLGEALKQLKHRGLVLHPALEAGWSKLYGYSSDGGGIRHAMQDDSALRVADALYFAVTCSAFVTLLTQHASELGIELKPVD